jgi:hypothetical protein
VALREGGFVLLESIAPGTDPVGQRYDNAGAPVGTQFTVATSGAAPQLTALPGGSLVAAWTRDAGGDQDVYLQLLQPGGGKERGRRERQGRDREPAFSVSSLRLRVLCVETSGR